MRPVSDKLAQANQPGHAAFITDVSAETGAQHLAAVTADHDENGRHV